jgi:serine protease Do
MKLLYIVILFIVVGCSAYPNYTKLYKQVQDGVVRVSVGNTIGSGFVVSYDGYVITNQHVVGNADTAKVTIYRKGIGMICTADVISRNAEQDLALLKVKIHYDLLRPVSMGDSDSVEIGQHIFAVGEPYGYAQTLNVGVIAAASRQVDAYETIQIDAAINPGNSGGPLFDLDGKVIGVNFLKQSNAEHIGFAIPINTVKELFNQWLHGIN